MTRLTKTQCDPKYKNMPEGSYKEAIIGAVIALAAVAAIMPENAHGQTTARAEKPLILCNNKAGYAESRTDKNGLIRITFTRAGLNQKPIELTTHRRGDGLAPFIRKGVQPYCTGEMRL